MATEQSKKLTREDLSDEQIDKFLELFQNDDDDGETMVQIRRYLWDPEGPKP